MELFFTLLCVFLGFIIDFIIMVITPYIFKDYMDSGIVVLLELICCAFVLIFCFKLGYKLDVETEENKRTMRRYKYRRQSALKIINDYPLSSRKYLKLKLGIKLPKKDYISLSDINEQIIEELLGSGISFEKEEYKINPTFRAKKNKTKAIYLLNKFPDATKFYFKQHWNIDKYYLSESDITDDKVDVLLSHEKEYKDVNEQCILKRIKIEQEILELKKQQERLQKLAREETERQIVIERQRQIEIESKSEILKRVSNWDTIKGILHFDYLVIYYPTTCTHKVSNIAWNNRKMIWNFKNTPGKTSKYDHLDAMTNVQYLLTNKLESTFSTNLLKFITFVCIPASTSEKTRLRYEEFSKRVCDATGMMNAYNYMEVIHDCSEKKFGGSGILTDNIHFDQNFFKGKYVLIFDDVITKGDSMLRFKNKMESLGATVIAGVAIGLTVHN